MSEENLTREISIIRTYETSAKRLFELLIDPVSIASWWGPDGFATSEVEVDAVIGGRYSMTMAGMGFSNRIIGKIVEFEEAKVLAVENRVENGGETILRSYFRISLEEESERTTLTLLARATVANDQMTNALLGMGAGWSQQMQRLDDALFERIDRTLVILASTNASARETFDYWTSEEKLSLWWGPSGFDSRVSDMDFQVGGGATFTMVDSDSKEHVNRITYREIDESKRLVFHHGSDGMQDLSFDAVVLFDEMGHQTVISMRFIFESIDDLSNTVDHFNPRLGAEEFLARLSHLL